MMIVVKLLTLSNWYLWINESPLLITNY